MVGLAQIIQQLSNRSREHLLTNAALRDLIERVTVAGVSI